MHVEMGGCKRRGPKWDPDSKVPSAEGSSPRILPLPAPSITIHSQISRGHVPQRVTPGWACFCLEESEAVFQEAWGKQRNSTLPLLPVFPSCFLAAMDPWSCQAPFGPYSHTSDKPSPWHLSSPSPFLLSLATTAPFWPILQPSLWDPTNLETSPPCLCFCSRSIPTNSTQP